MNDFSNIAIWLKYKSFSHKTIVGTSVLAHVTSRFLLLFSIKTASGLKFYCVIEIDYTNRVTSTQHDIPWKWCCALYFAKINCFNIWTFKWDTLHPYNSRGFKTAGGQSWRSKKNIVQPKLKTFLVSKSSDTPRQEEIFLRTNIWKFCYWSNWFLLSKAVLSWYDMFGQSHSIYLVLKHYKSISIAQHYKGPKLKLQWAINKSHQLNTTCQLNLSAFQLGMAFATLNFCFNIF